MTSAGRIVLPRPGQAWLDDGVQDGCPCTWLEMLHLAVQPRQYLGRVAGLQRVSAQRAAHPAHDDGRGQPGPGYVAYDQAEFARGQREHVVPVAADPVPAGNEPGSELRAGNRGHCGRQQAALEGKSGQSVRPRMH
jgi:hypothetical protein